MSVLLLVGEHSWIVLESLGAGQVMMMVMGCGGGGNQVMMMMMVR